ncbi:hypothetical protein [Segniliparus rugosus]|uniref:Uncharacterized protein n=1 Tax=Segniliparus rugosus (strain ATCC BAA-974 / DSM 45345 / CCUG 50838 / CIP 108380 / JCM 13579 / CDC 945) TaxID=679197 RepID=E5XLN9_SEGRC|nr:hypothetical protein [Segniliparus rugosus]EFV14717.1 hypothetical protein HMPREF9336_00408 [Segniliparus rugosus ATCC BAA-974]
MSRSVLALDVTVRAVSTARITDGAVPKCSLVHSDEIHGVHGPRENVRRHVEHAHRLVQAIIANPPELVVMAKNVWADMSRDPSGGRRSALFFEIVRQLDHADIPVCELSVLSAQKTIVGAAKFGAKGNESLAQEVRRLYPELVTPPDPEKETEPRYRVTTVGLALCGAMAAGIPTRLEVTTTRLIALQAGDWPRRFKPLSTATEWEAKFGGPPEATGDEPLSA